MKHQLILFFLIFKCAFLFSQYDYNSGNTLKYWAENSDKKLLIGAYGEIHYNQKLGLSYQENGILDVHRLVLLNGYQFNEHVSFLTEIEWEHVNEVTVEQAFLNYRFSPLFNFQAGLLLIPMGIINEFHEPTTFHSVERPTLDNKIIPSTWREIGLGFSGNSIDLSLQYQIYLINGLNGYDGNANFNGANGLRSGRQKGAESIISSPSIAGKINYYGIKGLQLGLSIFSGKSQSTLYDQLDKSDAFQNKQADSSSVFINMLGLDTRYNSNNFHLRGQFNVINLKNVDEYNQFAGSDLAKQLFGFYVEGAYTFLKSKENNEQFIAFSRVEFVDTHFKTSGEISNNPKNSNWILTNGLNWRIGNSVALKLDYQYYPSIAKDLNKHQINAGVGFWFR